MSHVKADREALGMVQSHFLQFWRRMDVALIALGADSVRQGLAHRAYLAGESADTAAVRIAAERRESST